MSSIPVILFCVILRAVGGLPIMKEFNIYRTFSYSEYIIIKLCFLYSYDNFAIFKLVLYD